MKKFLALALILTLALALSIGVSATRVVGDEGLTPSYNNGWTDAQFDPAGVTNNDTTIAITANAGGIQHRYAVDMDYTALSVTVVGEDLIWDVEQFKYVMAGDPAGNAPADVDAEVIFTNRSDLPINISYVVADGVANDLLTVTCAPSIAPVDGKSPLAAAEAGMTFNTAPKITYALEVVAEGNNWNNVAAFYANYFSDNGGTSATIATITFTISKVTP